MAEIPREFYGEDLLYVTCEDGSSKGWRVDLLVEDLSEGKLLLCSCCNGLMRDACICEEELRCGVCIPEGVAWQPVKMNRTIVNEKMIYCPLKWRGCGWSDKVSAAVHHLEGCQYLPVACPLRCVSLEGERKGEVVKIERKHIAEHVRDSCPLRTVICESCEGEVKASMMNPHLEDCEEFPLPCPNGCFRRGEEGMIELKRKDIPVHLDNHCPLQNVQCPYWDHGCREEMERRHIDTHERDFLHIHFKLSMTEMKDELHTAKHQISKLQKQVDDKTAQIKSLSQVLFFQQRIGTLQWNVKGVTQKILNKVDTYSDPFYIGVYKCQSSIEWNRKNTGDVGVFIHIMEGDFDAKLHWPIRYGYTLVLTNQINSDDNLVDSDELTKEDLEKYPECFKRPTGYRNEGFGHTSFISNTEVLEEKYCKEDSITLHISVEVLPPL